MEGGPHQEEVKKLKLKREAARKEFEVRQSLLSAFLENAGVLEWQYVSYLR